MPGNTSSHRKRRPDPMEEIIKASTIQGYSAKYEFDTEEEAKAFFDHLKEQQQKLPTYFKPKKS